MLNNIIYSIRNFKIKHNRHLQAALETLNHTSNAISYMREYNVEAYDPGADILNRYCLTLIWKGDPSSQLIIYRAYDIQEMIDYILLSIPVVEGV